MEEYSDKDKQDILAVHSQIQAVKEAMASSWWKDTMKALEDEIWQTLDDLKTLPWTYDNLAKICGKVYGMRAVMSSHEDLLGIEDTIDKARSEME